MLYAHKPVVCRPRVYRLITLPQPRVVWKKASLPGLQGPAWILDQAEDLGLVARHAIALDRPSPSRL